MTTVQLLGVEGSAQIMKLREHVKTALTELGVGATIELVTDVDELIRYRINGIPALIMNGKISFQKTVPSVEEIKQQLSNLHTTKKTSSVMKNILVPTDFSDTSKDAYLFALEIADKVQAQVKLLNICHPVVATDTAYLPEELEEMVSIAKDRLKLFAGQHKTEEGKGNILITPTIEQEVVIGFPVEELIHRTEDQSTDFIVMGTTGEKGILDKLFGSVSINVAQKAQCPVLLIPKGVKFTGFKHILFASDYENTNQETLNRLVEITRLFGSNLHLVHVSETSKDKKFKAIESKLVDELFKDGNPDFAFSISQIESESVVEGLNNYAGKNNVDLVVVVCPKRGFWNNLFHKSVTKELAWNTDIPLLTLH